MDDLDNAEIRKFESVYVRTNKYCASRDYILEVVCVCLQFACDYVEIWKFE